MGGRISPKGPRIGHISTPIPLPAPFPTMAPGETRGQRGRGSRSNARRRNGSSTSPPGETPLHSRLHAEGARRAAGTGRGTYPYIARGRKVAISGRSPMRRRRASIASQNGMIPR